jgi:hypothetical protein
VPCRRSSCYLGAVSIVEALVLAGGGLVAGVVNTLAGGASILSVPLLVLVGLPGNLANGTNRVGVLAQSVVAAWRFRAEGVSGLRGALPVIAPVTLGSFVGAFLVSLLPDKVFERLFGAVMVLLVVPMLWGYGARAAPAPSRRAGSTFWLFTGIGVFGGAFQAGVGLFLVAALAYAGYDLVRANSVKVVVNAVLTASALTVFLARGQVVWLPGIVLAAGFALGAAFGVRLAVSGGERLLRPVLIASVLILAGRMIGLY